MRKKLAMLMASLFLVLGTAWAQIPTASTAPADGQWNADTKWYTIKVNDDGGGYVSLYYSDCGSNLLLNNNTQPGADGLWCVVGNETDGYSFYNAITGASKVLGATGREDGGRMKMYDASAPGNGVTTVFDIRKLDGQDGYAFVRNHGENNDYWNHRDDYLAYWNNEAAYKTGCTGSQYVFTEVTSLADYASNSKTAILEALTNFAQLGNLVDATLASQAKAAVEANEGTDAQAITAMYAELQKVISAIESTNYAFRNSDTGNSNRIDAYLATRANLEKGHGTNDKTKWGNIVWSLKYASGKNFYLYNTIHSRYLGTPGGQGVLGTATTATYSFTVVDAAANKVKLTCGNQTLHLNNHNDGFLSNYDNSDAASQWYIENDLTGRVPEYKAAMAPLLTQAKELAQDSRLASSTELANLNAGINAVESAETDFVALINDIAALPALMEAAKDYIRESNKSYITALNYTENSNHPVIVNNKRSNWGVANNATGLNTLAKLGFAQSETDTKQQFAFITPDGGQNYYLYSIHAQRYLKSNNTFAAQGEPIAFADASSEGANRVQVRFRDVAQKFINVGGENQLTIDWWSTIDAGNACEIVQYNTLEFDLDYALKVFNEGAEVTIKYMLGKDQVLLQSEFLFVGDTKTISNNWAKITSVTVNGTPMAAPGGNADWVYTVDAAGPKEIVVNLELEDCVYALQSPASPATYFNFTPVTVEGNVTKATFQSSPSYLYIIPSENAHILKSKDNETVFVGSTHGWCVTAEQSLWNISEVDANGLVSITRKGDVNKRLGSDSNTDAGTAIFTNVGANCNKWKIAKAYPLTVVYQFEGAELTDLRVEKFVEPGTVYTIENSDAFDGKIIKSVEGATDNGDGTWAVTVNAATTVTVTLGYEDTDLYVLKSVTLGTNEDKDKVGDTYLNFTPITTQGTTTQASFQTTPSYLYITPENEAYFLQSLENEKIFIGSAHDWLVTTEKAYWNISEPDGDGYVTISRKAEPLKQLGHNDKTTANTGIFTNVEDKEGKVCNKWQLIPAYPITIIYKNSNDEVLETINAAAIIGTEYSFHIDTKGGELASCETDKGTIQVTDGTCTLDAVYGATTVTISIAPIGAVENPAAVVALVNRIGGVGTAESFKFVHDPALDVDGETFKIGAEDGKILIKGSTLSAITTGIGWYLNHIAHINIAWNSLNEKTTTVKWDANAGYANLSNLPLPTTEETHTSDAKYRYYLNYCTFGYSMTSWTWTRWQQEIDWMALHGINMPLQIVGLEEVWRTFLTMEDANGNRKYGYTDEEAKAFVAGPAFTAWWGMNNLEGWGGTSADGWGGVQDDAWYERQVKLAKQITDLQRALGMQPVLPGFSGMVPTNFTEKTTVYTDVNGGKWCGFQRPRIIDPTDARFAEIAADYYDCLEEVMGESQYYSMDPFHEGGSISSGKYTEAYKAVYDAMEATKPGSQWVIQQWQWNDNQKKSIAAVPAGRLIVLDLFSDGNPKFTTYNGYDPQEAVFCAIPNFGGRSGLMGRLQNVTDNYFKFKAEYPTTLKGIGTAPEAIEQTPVTYDLIYQLPWMNGQKPNVAEWVDNYAVARYGKDNSVVKEAWNLLRQGPLNYGADAIQGPVEDVWGAIPNLNANSASAWGETLNSAGGTYTPARRQMLIDAVYKLIDQKDALALEAGSVYESNYLYDLVEFGGGVMADYAYDLLLGIKAAKEAAGANFATDATYIARRDAFLALIEDVDAFKGTNLNFRLGKWTQEARDAASEVENATSATPDWYEFNNARTILTTWGDQAQSVGGGQALLRDYSYRSWQGLMKDVYLPRWQHYFDNNCTTSSNYFFFSWNWAHGMVHNPTDNAKSSVRLAEDATGYSYTREPENKNTVELANAMLGKYIIPVAMADGTHYAYRYLTNDLSSKVTIIAKGGSTIDLTKYFGALENAKVTGEFINGEATDLTQIAVKSDLTKDAYTGTITLADGTVLTFGVSANPKYYGVYTIDYKNGNNDAPVFVAYNTDDGSGTGAGYKLIATGSYSTTTMADKLFTIVPSGTGYSISAQGKYLKSPNLSAWRHILFSDDKNDAGAYIFEEVPSLSGVFKIRSTGSGINYINDWDKLVFGNDKSEKGDLSTFTIKQVTTYAVTIPEGGAAVCLPFNVVLPAGVTAYDVTVEGLTSGDDGAVTTLATIAAEGQVLKAGTPTLLKATADDYTFEITMDNTEAKTSSPESKLRGNFVKQTLQPGTSGINKYIFVNGKFTLLNAAQEIPANTCWIEAKIDAETVDVTEHQGKILKIDDWLLNYTEAGNGNVTLTDVAKDGKKDLVIGSHYTINGKTQKVTAISTNFMHKNTVLETVTFPATLTNLGFREIEPMFSITYEGKEGDGTEITTTNDDGSTTKTTQGMHRYIEFPKNPDTGKPWEVSGNFAWKLTLDVTIDNVDDDFNGWGSSIVSTDENSLADYYTNQMQIYFHKGHKKLIVKINNSDDRYKYGTKVLDEEGNETEEDLVMTNFKFELECDGAGNYQVVIYYENGKAKMYNISADQNSTIIPFSGLYYSLPEGIHVDVTFEKLRSEGLFVGCTNLKKIIVDPANPTFKSCEHGALYDKQGYYLMRLPEGGGHDEGEGDDVRRHFSIPSKVVKLYPGAIHGVDADIVLHSNPQIGVVKGHEHDVENARFYLSLDDIDNTIAEDETGYGGARDFISANNNTYVSANYKRAPLAEGKYGTIVLPFVATNWKEKYDFFEMTDADATSFHFSPVVDELKPNTAYLYKLKDGADNIVMGDEEGLDVFEGGKFTVQTHAKYDPNDEKAGGFRALGAYVNHYIDTEAANKKNGSFYYYYSISKAQFLKVTKKLTYRPYRALFVVTPEEGQAAQAPARFGLRILKRDGTTTEIDPSQIEGWEEDVYYDLQGRRVENPTQGIYIVNGRKVVIE